ncbi:DUF1062 domain-containing protein [Verrucosispora sp. WMMD573]|uniref:DUF1062 domain-containing protein n=1 Tax=Verrucosispora sp. WMMD573 TaxID=3015149 RepID=UPI00248C954C|nr:DUF1062 domain-containing protein [Verrucosispora sp. WMMD573]WBB53094.1 DUF1062 domain-containing protein [Verrucosispora sp. WMMD573]
MLPWVVRRTRLPLLSLRCVDCRSTSATTGPGRFRVNANHKLLDVWLLVRCVSCDRTSKLTVYERTPVSSFDPAELTGYRVNDAELVASRLLDAQFARRNRVTLDWTGAWRLVAPPAVLVAPSDKPGVHLHGAAGKSGRRPEPLTGTWPGRADRCAPAMRRTAGDGQDDARPYAARACATSAA